MINSKATNLRTRVVRNISQQMNRQQIQKLSKKSLLSISNQKSRFKLKYGQDFKHLIQARDRVLEHQFSFKFDLDAEQDLKEDQHLVDSKLYSSIKDSIKQFLAEAVGNIVSIGFKFLCEGELEQKEAKQFTSKNIMLNIHSIFNQTILQISKSQILSKMIDLDEMTNLLIIEIENILDNILINLADSYPQAPISGGTPRMREAINEVNRVDDEQNDFLYTSGIKIRDYLEDDKARQDQDYTQFIMRVINAIIEVTHDNSDDAKERTIFQKFTEFNQNLFWVSQEKDYHQVLSTFGEKDSSKKDEESIKTNICDYFDTIMSNKVEQSVWIRQLFQGNPKVEKIKKLWENSNEGLQNFKKVKKYVLGQKVPASVRPFTRQQLNNKQFTSKHSSILRILTKWAEYLESIFQAPEEYLKKRLYPFRNINNELVKMSTSIKRNSAEKLIKKLNLGYESIKQKFKEILKTSYGFIGKLLSQEKQSFVSSVARFNETRIMSSKINAVLTSLMLKYNNILIHQLIKAGQDIWTIQKLDKLNLVGFKVSDLMRSKYQCTQNGFINILKTMYMLDDNDSFKDKFKLTRIKNKLDDSANNIIVNYLFMGKVQCQLQLSIQDVKGKEKNYYAFSHFVYQLVRGKFGAIAECASMVAQLDPNIVACKKSYYREKENSMSLLGDIKEQIRKKGRYRNKDDHLEEKASEGKIGKETFFDCSNCSKLIITSHSHKFLSQQSQHLCFDCIIESKNPEEYLQFNLRQKLQRLSSTRIKSFHEVNFTDSKKTTFILTLNNSGDLTLFTVAYLQKQLKIFLIKINSNILKDIQNDDFDFDTLDHKDISSSVRRKSTKERLLGYVIVGIENIPDNILFLFGLEKEGFQKKSNNLLKMFQDYRLEKEIVQTIKFKYQIIDARQESALVLDRVVKALEGQKNDKQGKLCLKYKKFKHLSLLNIKEIRADGANFQKIPSWIKNCSNLKKLFLSRSRISQLNDEQLPQSLTFLSVHHNSIQSTKLKNLINLNTLILDRNKITSVDADILNLPSLTHLYLQENKLTQFDMGDNRTIKKLILKGNKLTQFKLKNENQLSYLNLANNNFEQFDVGQSMTLETLFLQSNKISTFTKGNCKKLTHINLNSNKLEKIDIDCLQGVEKLYLQWNKLKQFDLRENSSLTNLDVRNNSLVDFKIGEKNKLIFLTLTNNKLGSFDMDGNNSLNNLFIQSNELTDFNIRGNTSLTSLNLAWNKIVHFDLKGNNSLITLKMIHNQLQSFSLGGNNSLATLDLRGNKLAQFDMCGNTSLKSLYLQQNQLTSFDLGINENILYLNLARNNFNKINFGHNKNTKILLINHNPQLKQINTENLEQSIGSFDIDRDLALTQDFMKLKNLKTLTIHNGKLQRSELKNLSEHVMLSLEKEKGQNQEENNKNE